MKNILNSEKLVNIENNEHTFSNNNDSFYSFDFYPSNHKNLKRKRTRIYSGKNIYNKINKIQKNQNNTNEKLDILISIFKSKLLGINNYNISHYDLCIKSNINTNINNNEIQNKEDNDFNIKDDFGLISSIKKEPNSSSSSNNNLYIKKKHKIYDSNLNNKKDPNKTSNLKDIINDFLYENKDEKENNDDNGKNNIVNNGNEDIEKNEDLNSNINNEECDIKNKMKNDDQIIIKNVKTFGENNNINLLLNNANKSFKNEINLNKYKFEVKNNNLNEIIDNGFNLINEINNEKNNIVNNENKNESNNLELAMPNFLLHQNKIEENEDKKENEDIENININQEINKIESNEKNIKNIRNEDEKDVERKLDNSQSDSISVKSVSNSSPKKSNQGSSRKIRGFNFRNKIKMKNYNGNKFAPSSSNNNQKK